HRPQSKTTHHPVRTRCQQPLDTPQLVSPKSGLPGSLQEFALWPALSLHSPCFFSHVCHERFILERSQINLHIGQGPADGSTSQGARGGQVGLHVGIGDWTETLCNLADFVSLLGDAEGNHGGLLEGSVNQSLGRF